MKEKKRLFKKLPPSENAAIAAGAVLALLSAGLFALYFTTYYLPFGLCALIPAVPAVLIPVCVFVFPPDPEKQTRPRAVTGSSAAIASAAAAAVGCVILMKRMTSVFRQTWLTPLLCAVLFILLVIAEKVFTGKADDESADSKREKAVRLSAASALSASRIALLLIFVCTVVRMLGFYDATVYLCWAVLVIVCYSAAFTVLSFAVRMIRREAGVNPDLSIPVPFSGKHDLRVLGYLEKNTGITMHSLWSIKFLKTLLPYTVLFIIVTLWLSTSITVIEPFRKGALYRCGSLKKEPLGPGLHLTLPFPFDTVEKYETESVRKLTVGYTSDTDGDNIWTASHGSEEFQLLLGGGNELVSVNLRIEYKISDLIRYLESSSSPEKLLESAAYELITERIITTDLETLMAQDRESFADGFADELSLRIGKDGGIGLSVVSVVLESIHPPVSVASVYQELISANIKASKQLLDAEAYAKVRVTEAEQQSTAALLSAEADKTTNVADARAKVAEFLAGVEADAANPGTYIYEKYLSAIKTAYGNSKLVILGEGVDRSDIWLYGTASALN